MRRARPSPGFVAAVFAAAFGGVAVGALAPALSGLVAAVGALGPWAVWSAVLVPVTAVATLAGVFGGLARARAASSHLVRFGRVSQALGLRGEGPVGPWSGVRLGLRLELEPGTSTIRIDGLPVTLHLSPGPGASTGDPIFDREVSVHRSDFAARERGVLLHAVRRGLVVRDGSLSRAIRPAEEGDLRMLVDLAVEAVISLRDRAAPWAAIAVDDPAVEVRVAALRRCAERQPRSWLRERLQDPDPTYVAVAAEALLPETTARLTDLAGRPGGREALRIVLHRTLADPDPLLCAAWARGERDRTLLAWIGVYGSDTWFARLAGDPAAAAVVDVLRRRHGAPEPGRLSLAAVAGGDLSEAPGAGSLSAPQGPLHGVHDRLTDP